MEKRVELSLLLDFYGPLLTEHRRQVLEMYLNEDMGFQEIAETLGISRQGVHEAVKTASGLLTRYEETLGIARKYMKIRREIAVCRKSLKKIKIDPENALFLREAQSALDRMDGIER